MKFELTILGSNSAMPAYGRFMTAQILNVQEQLFLIDCGEGTQFRFQEYHIRSSRLNHIFISHLHGDHIFGLMGLLSSLSMTGRTKPMHIYSPLGLEEIVQLQIEKTQGYFPYPIVFHETNPEKHELVFENAQLEVYTIPLVHRVPTNGYLFREKKHLLKMRVEKLAEYRIPVKDIPAIKEGADWMAANGQLIPNAELTLEPIPPRSFAFCSDTLYTETILPIIKGVDLLYHEATFLHELLAQAEKTKHSTALQAGTIAQKAGVGKLIIGHYSSRYVSLKPLLEEAKSVFENTFLAIDGQSIEV